MILRRVIAHFRKQEWTAIAIDFVIVVMGVFVGIQVSNWNAARADKASEREFFANIADDLRTDARSLEDGIRMADANIRAGGYALSAAGAPLAAVLALPAHNDDISPKIVLQSPPETISQDEASHLWSRTMVRYFATPSDTALASFLATGQMSVISDAALLRTLATYRRKWIDVEASQNMTLRPLRNEAFVVGMKFGLSPFAEMPEDEFIALLRANPELLAAMQMMTEYAAIHRDILQSTLNFTREIEAAVAAKIERNLEPA